MNVYKNHQLLLLNDRYLHWFNINEYFIRWNWFWKSMKWITNHEWASMFWKWMVKPFAIQIWFAMTNFIQIDWILMNLLYFSVLIENGENSRFPSNSFVIGFGFQYNSNAHFRFRYNKLIIFIVFPTQTRSKSDFIFHFLPNASSMENLSHHNISIELNCFRWNDFAFESFHYLFISVVQYLLLSLCIYPHITTV